MKYIKQFLIGIMLGIILFSLLRLFMGIIAFLIVVTVICYMFRDYFREMFSIK